MTTTNRVVLKAAYGVDISVDTNTGRFFATYSDGDSDSEHSAGRLEDLEASIAKAVLGFTGSVAVVSVRSNPVASHTLDTLRKATDRAGSTRCTIKGIQRTERDRFGGGAVLTFRSDTGNVGGMQNDWRKPNEAADAEFAALSYSYLRAMETFHEQFAAVLAKYEPITSDEIVAELKRQGARTGSAR